MGQFFSAAFRLVLGAYFWAGLLLFAPYYNWQYATTHGFTEWLFFGEVVATAKAIAWPYFLLESSSSNGTPSHINAAIYNHKQAARIINKGESVMSKTDLDAIIDYYRKAVAAGKEADVADMNRHYATFGDRFRDDFIHGMELVIDGCGESRNMETCVAGQVLIDRWGDWYEANRAEISTSRSIVAGAVV